MSELQNNPNPEKEHKPLVDNCDNCSEDYELTADNSILNHYSTQDECDHIDAHCPHCGYETLIFVQDNLFRQAVDSGIFVAVEKNAPQTIYEGWRQLYAVELPKTYELTNRHEATIRKFGENLLSIPDDVFWDNIEAPTEKPYPLRWIEG